MKDEGTNLSLHRTFKTRRSAAGGQIFAHTESNCYWDKLCKENEDYVLEKYGVVEGKRGGYKGRRDEAQWWNNKVNYNHV